MPSPVSCLPPASLAVLLMTGLAVSLAARLAMVPNLSCCSLLFLGV
jgi:hypothetical protein